MSLPAWIKANPYGVTVSLKVQPRASRNEIVGTIGEQLKVKVTAPPVDSAANEAVLRFLSDALDCPHQAVTLVRGGTSRSKVIAIQGLTAEQVVSKLGS